MNLDFILTCGGLSQVMCTKLFIVHSVTSFDATQKCDDFWLPGAESLSMLYNMNDYATSIFAASYTLIL